jgi:MSHA biogenesis protein MshJ
MTGKAAQVVGQWLARVDALSLRERVLIFAAVMVVLFFGIGNLVIGPLNESRKQLGSQLTAVTGEAEAIEAQIGLLGRASREDPDAALRAHIAELRQQLEQTDERLGVETAGLVAPRDMARLVEQVVSRQQAVELVSIESLPGEVLLDTQRPRDAGSGADRGPGLNLYRQGMVVTVRGTYMALLDYLRALEALQWNVFWGKVELQVEAYPVSKLSVVIYTISRESGWIGT